VIGDGAVATICSSGPLAASHAVERLPTLAAAVSRVRTVDRAIVLTELQLPDGDGVELCRVVKSVRRMAVVLVCTNDAARVPRALMAGCDSVLLKPFAPNLCMRAWGV
jgi:DNA-binding response OmpR family regulator